MITYVGRVCVGLQFESPAACKTMTWRTHDLSQIIEQIPIGVAVTLPSGAIEYVNPYLSAMLRSPPAQLDGVDLADLRISGSSSQNERMRRRLLAREPWREEAQFVTASGDKLPVLESAYPLRDKEGRVTHFIHFLQDPSLVEISEPSMSTMFYDKLTGPPNRNLFHNRLSLAMGTARRSRHGFAVLSADIDHFKLVNDSLGHDAGDDLLRQVAARMRTCLRETDTVARLGGDEFGAILDRVLDSEIAAQIADKFLAACCGSYELRGNAVRVTMSVGLSLYPRDGQEADILLKRADLAMYRAKATGRNRSELRDPGPARRYGFA